MLTSFQTQTEQKQKNKTKQNKQTKKPHNKTIKCLCIASLKQSKVACSSLDGRRYVHMNSAQATVNSEAKNMASVIFSKQRGMFKDTWTSLDKQYGMEAFCGFIKFNHHSLELFGG